MSHWTALTLCGQILTDAIMGIMWIVAAGGWKKHLICPLRMCLWVGEELCLSTYEEEPLSGMSCISPVRRVHTTAHHSGDSGGLGRKHFTSQPWGRLSHFNLLQGKWWAFTSKFIQRMNWACVPVYSMIFNDCMYYPLQCENFHTFYVSTWNARRVIVYLKVNSHC